MKNVSILNIASVHLNESDALEKLEYLKSKVVKYFNSNNVPIELYIFDI